MSGYGCLNNKRFEQSTKGGQRAGRNDVSWQCIPAVMLWWCVPTGWKCRRRSHLRLLVFPLAVYSSCDVVVVCADRVAVPTQVPPPAPPAPAANPAGLILCMVLLGLILACLVTAAVAVPAILLTGGSSASNATDTASTASAAADDTAATTAATVITTT